VLAGRVRNRGAAPMAHQVAGQRAAHDRPPVARRTLFNSSPCCIMASNPPFLPHPIESGARQPRPRGTISGHVTTGRRDRQRRPRRAGPRRGAAERAGGVPPGGCRCK
jgi:hypothetical protein